MKKSHRAAVGLATGLEVAVLSILTLIFSSVLVVTGMLWEGFVVTKLWNWFIMESFDTIKMHYALGIGLAILVGFLTRTLVYKPKERESDLSLLLNYMYLSPAFMLLLGYIVHHWV